MFTKEQTKIMKPVLGVSYTADVLSVLETKGVTSRKNMPYKPNTIRTIFNGAEENLEIEEAILEVYKMRKDKMVAIESKRDQLLNTELA